MQVHTVFRNGERSNRLRTFTEEALAKLDRVHDKHGDAHVTYCADGLEKRAEVRLHVRGQELVCSERAESYEAALDRCVESLRRSLLRHKDLARTHDPERDVWH